MKLGAHESIAGGLHQAFVRAQEVGCDAVQLFVKSNRQWKARPLTDEDVQRFRECQADTDIEPAVAHASYLLNLASPNEELWTRSRDTLLLELERCERLGIPGLVLHPGSHTGSGEEAGLARVALALGEVHARSPGFKSRILLETMAGQGTNLGYRFEHLAWLLANTPQGERLGTCFDTCHVFAAGYELRTPEGYAETLQQFDEIVGLDTLGVLHLNDSKADLGSRKDRHAHIGEGCLGLEAFRRVVNDARFQHLAGLLETPKEKDLQADRENLERLRSLIAIVPLPPPAGR